MVLSNEGVNSLMYQTAGNSELERVTADGNISIGYPISWKENIIRDNFIYLSGPPIDIFHPADYNNLFYRFNPDANDGNGGEMQYGVAGIYNITTASWQHSNISKISVYGTTIELSVGVSVDDEVMIFYYAKPNTDGGTGNCCVDGSPLSPETADMLIRAYNDAVPTVFGNRLNNRSDTQKSWQWASDLLYYQKNTLAGTTWHEVINTNTAEHNHRLSDYPPWYITEMVVKIDQGYDSLEWVRFQLNVDGTQLFQFDPVQFNTQEPGPAPVYNMEWRIPDLAGSATTVAHIYDNHPGRAYSFEGRHGMFLSSNSINDAWFVSEPQLTFRFPLGMLEIINNVKLSLYFSHSITRVMTYFRGYGGVST